MSQVDSINTDLKKMGWSVNEGAEDSLSVISSLPEVGKLLWLTPLGAGTEMMGAGSWLGPACLEKLHENSGGAAFLVLMQTAQARHKGLVFIIALEISGGRSSVRELKCWLVNVTFLCWWREKFHFG